MSVRPSTSGGGGRTGVGAGGCLLRVDGYSHPTNARLPPESWSVGEQTPGARRKQGEGNALPPGLFRLGYAGSSWDLGSLVPSVRPAPRIPPRPSACPSPPFSPPRTPGPFPTGGWGAFCSYFSARAGAGPRVKIFPPTPLPERIPRGPVCPRHPQGTKVTRGASEGRPAPRRPAPIHQYAPLSCSP